MKFTFPIIALFFLNVSLLKAQNYDEISLGKGIKGETVALFNEGDKWRLYTKNKK